MKLLEYQAISLFNQYQIPTMKSAVLSHGECFDDIAGAEDFRFPLVVKAQIASGGRGKAGGIRFAQTMKDARKHCRDLLGRELLGYTVYQVLLTEKADVRSEWYLSIILDRVDKCPMIIFSPEGGMDIEELARTQPQKILRLPIDPFIGVQPYTVSYLLAKSGLSPFYQDELYKVICRLYQLFLQQDALLTEINPLAVCGDDERIIALDGKVEIDDSALYRQKVWLQAREVMPEEDFVKEARAFNFLYIPVEKTGPVAVISNGSGMLMSCIDLIAKEGIQVSAALDLGGGATADRISQGLRIMLSTPGVKVVLINIFGGITRCDEVAQGVRDAVENYLGKGQFVIVRMEGTNKEKGVAMLEGMDNSLLMAEDIRQSVDLLVERRDLL
ncbi:MAG TPA: succinate--CoA ligase subunit beta [Clostridiales bacterium]|jgi:succinyl-CoA synthetase beta subunit|nr:succinate--CoA ligase subunit beta [Clostridiales bacterium]